ncbi:SLC13 family permease [Echinimonas agarilytica]|uniref:SLC13 family permease n=1 Tax=Echinimonas agarilytica TaxID=1215918 RepID=A0AA42B6Q7_9GAMM|nr:SLC13 family permease [Echinimonas agarilytica]MCM2679072.1 SLC13 family permease [Echinimonas agarilytica]
MTLQSWLVVAVFIATLAGLIQFQKRPAIVFGCTLLAVFGLDLVSTEQMLSSLVNPGLVTLILLIICSFALEKTRFLRFVASKVIRPGFKSTWLRLFTTTVCSSALLNNTAVVATLIAPIRSNPHHPAGKLLLPLSYAAILGGTLTLIGTSTNLIVDSMLFEAGGGRLDFFAFSAVGALAVLFGGVTCFFVSRWLPATRVTEANAADYFLDAKVQPSSPLIGKSVEENGLRHLESLFLVEIARGERLISPVTPAEIIQDGDRLAFSGDVSKVMQLSHFDGLKMFADTSGLMESNLTEVVVRPDSSLIGLTLKNAGFRARFDAAVVAMRRDGQRLSGKLGEVKIQAGDFLVLAVGPDFSSRNNLTKNFIVISGMEPESKLKGRKELIAGLGFLAVVGLAATGTLSLLKGLMLFLGVLYFTNCLSLNEVQRRLPLDIWLVVASALTLAHALTNTGMVQSFSGQFAAGIGQDNLYLAFVAMYLLTLILTELVTNNAAAALVFPISYGLALGLGVDPMPFIMAVAFGASASFISPYGYQTNLMVYNAGQYQIKDFLKAGLPVSVVYSIVVLLAVPYFFPF